MLEFSDEVKHRIFINKMVNAIADEVDVIFHPEGDPEVLWSEFYKRLRAYKKEHLKSYEKYMEADATTEAPESEIAKFRRINKNI